MFTDLNIDSTQFNPCGYLVGTIPNINLYQEQYLNTIDVPGITFQSQYSINDWILSIAVSSSSSYSEEYYYDSIETRSCKPIPPPSNCIALITEPLTLTISITWTEPSNINTNYY